MKRFFLIGCIGLSSFLLADDSRLHQFENQTKPAESKPAPPAPPPQTHPEPDCREQWERDHPGESTPANYCNGAFEGELGAMLVGAVLLAPFYGPALGIGDHYDHPKVFADFPYDNGRGYVRSQGKDWLVRAGASRLWSVDNTSAWRGDLSVLTSTRFGLDSSYTRYSEHIGDESDSLAFFDLVPTFAFARTAKWDWRLGIGYEGVQGREHHDRLKLVYNVRYLFSGPIRLDADFGVSLASGKPIFDIAPGLAYHWDRYEIKAGYHRRNISDVVLEGPELELSVWF